MQFFNLLSGVFSGWSLGVNNTSNIFGAAVSKQILHFYQAALLFAIFVTFGAVSEGGAGMVTLSHLSSPSLTSATLITCATALAVTLLTFMRLPISVSQAVVGAILGHGLQKAETEFVGLGKVLLCWLCTPVVAMLIGATLYFSLRAVIRHSGMHFIRVESYLKIGLVLVGCYGAYTLGSNNVANVVGVFWGLHLFGLEGDAEMLLLALVGSGSIALGTFTYGHRVMSTVGEFMSDLDVFSAFVAVLSHSLTLHVFTLIGVPVSSTQAVIGAIVGIIFVKSTHLLNYRPVMKILSGWLATPLLAGAIAFAGAIII